MQIKTIHGRKFDSDTERVLSFRNKSFYINFQEFKPYRIKEFIDYLMSGTTLDWEWNSRGGYNDLKYTSASGEERILYGNHGMTNILRGIESGKFDPSDVLHDFVTYYRGVGFCDDSTKEERLKLYAEVKALILSGFSVNVVDHR